MAYGVTSTGFALKRLVDIKTETEDALRLSLGNYINLLPSSVLATLVGIFAERESLVWELAQDVYNSQYPDTASDSSLDSVVALSGITRLDATKSVVETLYMYGDIGTLIPAGTQISVAGNPTAAFETDNDVTLIAGVNAVQTISFSGTPASGAWQIQYLDQTSAVLGYNAIAFDVEAYLNAMENLDGITVTGSIGSGFVVTFAGDSGLRPHPLLTFTTSLQTAGAVAVVPTAQMTIVGVEQGSVACTATETGEVAAPAYTLTNIDTPVSGLDRVVNPSDAVVGRERETDLELRARRADTLQIAGSGTLEAVRSRLLNLDDVLDVITFENDTFIVDTAGRPPKSYEVVVDGGEDQTIADTIWASKPAGMQTFGNQESEVIDSQGVARAIFWSRPTTVDIYFSLDLTVDANFPVDGAAQAEAAIVAYGNTLGIGTDVIIYPRLVSALRDIDGILDVRVRIDSDPVSNTPGAAALDDNISVAINESAAFDSSRGSVNIL